MVITDPPYGTGEFVEIARTRPGNGCHNPARQRVEGQEELL